MEKNSPSKENLAHNAYLVIWIHNTKKILSFQPQPDFSSRRFQDKTIMWDEIAKLVDAGYLVQ